MESFEHMGYWWLPEDIESRKPIRGTLSFDPATGGRLRLYGQLYPSVEFSPLNPKEIGIIHGEIDEVAFTLQGCYAIESYQYPGVNETLVDVIYIYEGHRFSTINDMVFESVTVSYPYLDDWIDHGRLEVTIGELTDDCGEEDRPVRKVWTFEDLAFAGAKVPFEQVEFYTTDGVARQTEYRITRNLPDRNSDPKEWRHRARISITPNEALPFFSEVSGKGFAELVFVRIPNFLSLATSRVNDPLSIRGDIPNLEEPSSVRIYCPVLEPKYSSYQKILFAYDDVKEHLPEYFSNWSDKYGQLREVYDLYFRWSRDLHRGRLSHATTQFLDMARILEVYQRRMYPKTYICETEYRKLKKPIIKLIRKTFCKSIGMKLISEIGRGNQYSFRSGLECICFTALNGHRDCLEDLLGDVGEFVRTVVDTRNKLTHILQKPGKYAIQDDDLKSLHQYVTKMRILLRMCFLAEMEFPPDLVKRLVTENREHENLM